jgi:hypothetical protein
MVQRLQLPHESVMEYYFDKIHLCLQADSNMKSSIIIHHLIKGLKQSLIPPVIRRHPSTPADFLTIAQDEEQIQFILCDLSRASINPPDNYPNDNDSIDESVMVVTQSIDTDKRPTHYQQPALFLSSRVHDQHPVIFNQTLQQTQPEQALLHVPVSTSIISKQENDVENNQLDSLNDKQITLLPDLENKCLNDDEQDCYLPMLDNINDIDLEIQEQHTDEQADLRELEQQYEGVLKSVPVKNDVEDVFEVFVRSMNTLPADDTLMRTTVPPNVHPLSTDKTRPRKPRVFNKLYSDYDWNQYNKKRYDPDIPIPYEYGVFTIVSTEGAYSYRYGSRCYFQNGTCQLWFYYRKWKYRKLNYRKLNYHKWKNRRQTFFFFFSFIVFIYESVLILYVFSFSFVSFLFLFVCLFVLSLREQMKLFTVKGGGVR